MIKIMTVFLMVVSISYSQDFWQKAGGVFNNPIKCLAINLDGDIFAGTDGGGIFRSSDNGDSWIEVNNGLTWFKISSIAINFNGDIFAGSFFKNSIFRSTDNGDNWIEVNNGLESSVNCLAINKNGDIFAGTGIELSPPGGGVFRSSDNGESWNQVNNGLTYLYIKSLIISSSGNIFAGTNGGGIFRSLNNGDNWSKINEELETEYNSIIIDSIGGNIYAGSKKGVFYSSDHGDNWTRISDGLTQVEITNLAINSNRDIFAGIMNRMSSNTGKVCRLDADNEIWIEIREGLSNSGVINCLAINSQGHIFAGSDNLGVFRSINSTVSIDNNNVLNIQYNLGQNYPNPFNPSTKISYSIPNQNFVSLKVFDVLGREVKVLVSREQAVGKYKVEFDGSKLTSGIYFYRINAGDFVETRKMIVMK